MSCCNKRYPFDYFYPPYTMQLNWPNTVGVRPTVYMRDEYIDCWFYGLLAERHIDGLVYQYDKGLILNVRGLDTDLVNKIQFTRPDDTVIIDQIPTVIVPQGEYAEDDPDGWKYLQTPIPDELLEKPGEVVAYLVYDNEGEFRTVKTIYITVHPRSKVIASDEEETCCDKIAALTAQIEALAAKLDNN